MGFLTCESRQQAIKDASGDHCQLIVIANALSLSGEDTLDTGCFGRLVPPNIQVVDNTCQACQAWLLNGKALNEGFEGNTVANVAEPGPIKIEAERIAWAVTGTGQPNESGVGIDETTDQPGTCQPVYPWALSRCPSATLVFPALQMMASTSRSTA